MNPPPMRRLLRNLTILGLASSAWLAHGQALDVAAAEALAKKSNCTKCHSVDKKKDGPSYKEVAVKYKGKPDAQDRIVKHLTTGEKAKFPDGHEEEHKIIKAKDAAEVKNLVDWILAQ